MNHPTPPSITCPVCRRTSYHPNDIAQGFCGYCHDWTSPDLADLAGYEGLLMTEPDPDQLAAYRRQARTDPDPGWPPDAAAAAEVMFPAGVDALATVEQLIDAPPITAPQAQGDVGILPWPPETAPAWRGQEIDACTPMTMGGVRLTPDGSHWLLPERLAPEPIGWHETRKGYTLGTLVVPPAAAARLSHRRHGDLLIGPGVYVLRQQRAYTGTRTRRHHTTPASD